MLPYDALFLSLAATCCYPRPARWWAVAIVPLWAWGLAEAGHALALAAPWVTALTAASVTWIAPHWAAAALLLAVPRYDSAAGALATCVSWVALVPIIEGLFHRLHEPSVPPRLAGWPIRLLALGSLYYALLPLAWLR
jgi:hypothetical protein